MVFVGCTFHSNSRREHFWSCAGSALISRRHNYITRGSFTCEALGASNTFLGGEAGRQSLSQTASLGGALLREFVQTWRLIKPSTVRGQEFFGRPLAFSTSTIIRVT